MSLAIAPVPKMAHRTVKELLLVSVILMISPKFQETLHNCYCSWYISSWKEKVIKEKIKVKKIATRVRVIVLGRIRDRRRAQKGDSRRFKVLALSRLKCHQHQPHKPSTSLTMKLHSCIMPAPQISSQQTS